MTVRPGGSALERDERRERRYIRVTPAGLRMLREARRRFQSLWNGLSLLTDEG